MPKIILLILLQAPAIMSTANGMNGALADPAVAPEAVGGWASNDAFASGFDDNKSPVSRERYSRIEPCYMQMQLALSISLERPTS